MENPTSVVQGPNLKCNKLVKPTHNKWSKAGCLWKAYGPSYILFGLHDFKKNVWISYQWFKDGEIRH